MRLELGINTCFAVKRWPRPADWAAVVRDELRLTLVQHSLDLVDLDAGDARLASQAAAVREAASAFGLRIHSTFTGLAAYSSNLLLDPDLAARSSAADRLGRSIELTAALGAIATGGHVGAYSVADWRDPRARARGHESLRDSLAALSSTAQRAGLEYLVVENLAAAREPSTIAGIEALLSEGDEQHVPIRLCLDVGHMCVPGTSGEDRDPYAWLRRFGRRAPIVQLQQSDAAGDHHWPFTPATNRAGRIEAEAVIDALEGSGAQSVALVLEVIPPFEQDDDEVLADLVASVDYWREALARRGFAVS
jgi:sugar phosphate isomerase/epimerase